MVVVENRAVTNHGDVTGTIDTLRHVKKEVDEMKKGSECGMSFDDWDELEAGDQIQFIEVVEERRKL